jgi:hypothetical protein
MGARVSAEAIPLVKIRKQTISNDRRSKEFPARRGETRLDRFRFVKEVPLFEAASR